MKPKIELGKEYPTRGGGKAVVHFIDHGRLLGRAKNAGSDEWVCRTWFINGRWLEAEESCFDILLPRTVLVPVEVPEWANYVRRGSGPSFRFFQTKEEADFLSVLSIEDWIASLEGEDERT